MPAGPTIPNPGPILNKVATEADVAVVKSTPVKDSAKLLKQDIPRNRKVSDTTFARSSGDIVLSPTLT